MYIKYMLLGNYQVRTDELAGCFGECLASGVATLVQSNLQHKSEGHGCQLYSVISLFWIFQKKRIAAFANLVDPTTDL